MVQLKYIPPATCSRCSDAKVVYGFDGSGKVGRQNRFGQNLPPAERIQPENLATACPAQESIRQRKQATDGKSEDINERLTDEAEF